MKNHKPNCRCCYCRNKRGEMKGKNCSNYGRKHTNPTCQCASCKSKRGETKGINCPNYNRHPSEEQTRKFVKSRKNNGKPWNSEETITKMKKKS